MPQSEPSDFEFDVSDLDVETPEPLPKQDGEGASAPEQAVDAEAEAATDRARDPDQAAIEASVEAQREALAEAVGESAPEDSSEDLDEIAGASFDIAELPEIFSSPEAIAASEPEAREVEVELAGDRQPQTLRALGADDLGADVFAELAAQDIGEDAKLDFEDALEDLLSAVDAFDTGADGGAFGADGALDSELDADGLPLRSANADDDEITARQAGREAGKLQPAAPPIASANPGGPVPLPADPKPETPLRPLVFDTIPSDEQLEPELAAVEPEELEPTVAESEPAAEEPELFVPEPAAAERAPEIPETPEAPPEPAAPQAAAESPELEVEDDAFDFAKFAVEDDVEPEAAVADLAAIAEDEAPADAPPPADEIANAPVEPVSSEPPAEVPELAILDDDDGDDEEIVAMPSAEDLLRHAGSLFNMGEAPAAIDDDDAVGLPDFAAFSQELEEAAPSPSAAVAIDEEDEDGPFDVMPDPAALIAQAAAQSEQNSPPKAPKPFSGNVADRAGNLPPPPPAPVEIIDDDPLDVDPAPYIAPSAPAPQLQPLSPEIKDPFANDDALDGFNIGFENPDDLEDALSAQLIAAPEGRDGDDLSGGSGRAPKVAAPPKPSLLWRITHSLAVAAGLALIGIGWLLSAWRQEIMEYIDGRDLDASGLVAQIRQIGLHALEGFDEAGLYRMQWLDSDLRTVSRNEIRLHARIAAQLREDLYAPTFESYVEERFEIDFSQLDKARQAASGSAVGELPEPPEKPWESLYQLATPRGEILLLRAVYQIVREDSDSDWKFQGVRLAGYDQDLVWPSGQPRSKFGDRAFDVDSAAFANVLADYRERSENYVARVAALTDAAASSRVAALRELEERRQRVRQSMSKGAYFTGVAILGEDAADSEDVTMLITATEGDGAMVRGVFKQDGASATPKHFVGSLNFVSPAGGEEIGVLNVTTVAFEGEGGGLGGPPFFNPGTVSRIRLKTDGMQLEGDTPDISLRLHRAM